MSIEVKVKRWGNSLGVILPQNYLEERGISLNDEIIVEAFKVADISKAFGSLKRKMSGQEFKDMVREGW